MGRTLFGALLGFTFAMLTMVILIQGGIVFYLWNTNQTHDQQLTRQRVEPPTSQPGAAFVAERIESEEQSDVPAVSFDHRTPAPRRFESPAFPAGQASAAYSDDSVFQAFGEDFPQPEPTQRVRPVSRETIARQPSYMGHFQATPPRLGFEPVEPRPLHTPEGWDVKIMPTPKPQTPPMRHQWIGAQ